MQFLHHDDSDNDDHEYEEFDFKPRAVKPDAPIVTTVNSEDSSVNDQLSSKTVVSTPTTSAKSSIASNPSISAMQANAHVENQGNTMFSRDSNNSAIKRIEQYV